MSRLRSLLVCTCAFTFLTILFGCGANSVPLSSSNPNNGTGPVPAVTAQAIEVNGVAPNRKQEVQFSEAMDPATINNKTFAITDAGGNPVPGDVSYDSSFNIGIFQPTPALQTDTTYTATVTTGAASTGGMHLAAPYAYSFTTRADTDSSPLTVSQVSPAANAVCVSASAQIMITFNEAPDASTVTAQNIVVTDSSGNKIATMLSMNVSNTEVVVTPTSPLPSGTITVTVSGVADLADVAMQQPYTWSFSTACNGGGGGPSGNSAFVYVSIPSISGGPGKYITGYASAADGTLTQVPGSPFTTSGNPAYMTTDHGYLYVAEDGTFIDAYSIGSTGSLTAGPTTNASSHDNPPNEGGPISVFTDRTGASLYANASFADQGNNRYQAYAVGSGGNLSFVNMETAGNPTDPYVSFTPNDLYGYSSDCNHGTQNFYGWQRGSDGSLTYFDPKANLPAGPTPNPGGISYCPYGAAVPDNSHVVIAMQQGTDPYSSNGINQLAVYAIASDGTLSTTDSDATMPTLAVGHVNDFRFDPTGTWLAAGGDAGLQIFRYANGKLTAAGSFPFNSGISQVQWDSAGHVYTYGQDSGDLYVFNVVNGVPTPAPGSPTTLGLFGFLAVQPAQ